MSFGIAAVGLIYVLMSCSKGFEAKVNDMIVNLLSLVKIEQRLVRIKRLNTSNQIILTRSVQKGKRNKEIFKK